MEKDFELENMRLQMTMLKKKLQQQEIINDRLIRQSLRSNTSSIKRRYFINCLVCMLMIPYGYWAFCMLNGSSIGVWIMMSILMLCTVAYTIYIGWFLYDEKLYSSNLLAARQKVARSKRLDGIWLVVGIPVALLWLAYFIYDKYLQMGTEDFKMFVVVMFIAAIFGVAIGLKIHFRNQHNYQEIIDQIEDFSKD